VENFHRGGQALKSTLNFLGKSPCIYLGFSDRDRSLKQVRTLGTLKFRPLNLQILHKYHLRLQQGELYSSFGIIYWYYSCSKRRCRLRNIGIVVTSSEHELAKFSVLA
jgi:hypothetical protein